MFSPTDHNIGQIRALRNAGKQKHEIALQLNCSISTVKRWFRRLRDEEENGQTFDRRRLNEGRPEKLSAENLQLAVNTLVNQPFLPVKALPAMFPDRINVHEETLRNSIKKHSYLRCYKAAKKTNLHPRDPQARLDYANQHLNIPIETWRRTIMLDEKIFSTVADGEFLLQ